MRPTSNRSRWEVLAAIIEREQPDAVLPTLGGQTGLNIAMELFERGLIGVPGTPEMIGANAEAIATAEDRALFKQAMIEIGLEVPRSGTAHTLDAARVIVEEIGLPIIIRPAYILGGRGTGIASTPEEFERLAAAGIAASPIGEILVEESIAGWKEYELEVMRDRADNCVIICGIENVDPMGVHTGDSITVAPIQTLSDVEYQQMRNASIACIRRVGVETGGSNVQFAVDPETGRQVVIEMNPRVSRSSALASKATGFPIAKIAARLAVGYTLDEIPNDITATAERSTPASFEPVLDYVVTKIPRWAFEKLPGTTGVLGTQMQSVGEVMAIGRTFPESLQKALRSLEQGRAGMNCDPAEAHIETMSDEELVVAAGIATPDRLFQVGELLRRGFGIDAVHAATKIDPWFLDQISMIVEERHALAGEQPVDDDAQVVASCQAARVRRCPARLPVGRRRVRRAHRPRGRRGAADLQDRRHLRRRVRRRDAVPLLHVRGRDRGPLERPPEGRHPRFRSQPHRPGHRVRLLLRARVVRPARGRLRDGDDQLQPGDGVDRLRHVRPPVLRAADEGRRAQRAGRGATAPCDRVARRADAAEAGRRDPAGTGGRHLARLDRCGRGPAAVERDLRRAVHPAASRWHGQRPRTGPVHHRRDRLPRPRAAQLCAGRPGDADRPRPQPPGAGDGRIGRLRQPRQGGRALRRATRADRPLPRRRHRGRRRRDPRCDRRGADRRGDGARRRGGRPLRRLGVCDPAADAAVVGRRGDPLVHGGDRQAPRGRRPDQRPVRRRRDARST